MFCVFCPLIEIMKSWSTCETPVCVCALKNPLKLFNFLVSVAFQLSKQTTIKGKTMNVRIILVFLLAVLKLTGAYQWTVFQEEEINFCFGEMSPLGLFRVSKKLMCGDREHTMCKLDKVADKKCRKFEKMELTNLFIRSIVLGHNGLRNKVANDESKPAANMNYLVSDLESIVDLI